MATQARPRAGQTGGPGQALAQGLGRLCVSPARSLMCPPSSRACLSISPDGELDSVRLFDVKHVEAFPSTRTGSPGNGAVEVTSHKAGARVPRRKRGSQTAKWLRGEEGRGEEGRGEGLGCRKESAPWKNPGLDILGRNLKHKLYREPAPECVQRKKMRP